MTGAMLYCTVLYCTDLEVTGWVVYPWQVPGPLRSAELMMSGTWPPGGCHSTTAVLDPDLATWKVSVTKIISIAVIIISIISIA